jgi:hypothetical protein
MTIHDLDRRRWLTKTGMMAAITALWPAGVARAHDNENGDGADLVIDVAGTGIWPTFPGPPYAPTQSTPPPDFGGTDSRGASGLAEGLIYRAGTIQEGAGFDPFSAPAIGHYFARGWFLAHLDRPFPHIVTTHEYLFGIITPERPSPVNTLVSSGVEGGIELAHRAVIGGSGRYRHARGDVQQRVIGTTTGFAPTFRFTFRF